MKLIMNLKKFLNNINKFERSISNTRMSYLEVYERNLILEKEILERTNELEKANKTFLRLQNIWDMMNSEKPLYNILEVIVDGLKGEFGYIHSSIFKLCTKSEEIEEPYFVSKAAAKGLFLTSIINTFKFNPKYIKIDYNPDNIFAKALTENRIITTNDFAHTFKNILPEIEDQKIVEFFKNEDISTLICIPIKPNQEEFGLLLVYSSRPEINNNEINFLSLFAHQIELAITIARLFETVKKQALTDSLTELYNRRYFEECLYREAKRSIRLNQPFTLISIDLDHLKIINDKYGHQYGDLAIQTISKVLKNNARAIDVPSRFGGEEFNILLPGIDSKGGAIAAERIRSSIENQTIEKIGNVTASIGVVTYLEHTKDINELLELGDQAMYQAKLNGRNQVCFAKEHNSNDWQKIAVGAFFEILTKQLIPISKSLNDSLINKIQDTKKSNTSTSRTLFNVVDSLNRTYNINYENGTTELKVSLAVKFAKSLKLPDYEIDKLKIAILFYDIGNTTVPEEIFKKNSWLTYEEKLLIRKHPITATKEILEPITSVNNIIPIIELHHENWDGSGYPYKKSGLDIPVTSQIILLVDTFFALISERPHRNAYSQKEAINIIKNDSNKKFNPDLVLKFVDLIENTPSIFI